MKHAYLLGYTRRLKAGANRNSRIQESADRPPALKTQNNAVVTIGSWSNAVAIVPTLMAGQPTSIPGRDKRFVFFPKRPGWLSGPSSLLFNATRSAFRRDKEVEE